jgi:hypothetical protein
MTPFAAPPAEEGPLQQLGVEPIGLRPAMLTRHGDTGCVDHMGFDTARPQPPPQPTPSRPASKATAILLIARPARSASAPP